MHYGRKHPERIFGSAQANRDKTMTQAFHLEADNIPVTFHGTCQELDGFIELAGDTAQETRLGWGALHSLYIYTPKNATV